MSKLGRCPECKKIISLGFPLHDCQPKKIRKTEHYIGIAFVERAGFECMRSMPWESPIIIFRFEDGRRITWHSDSIENIIYKQDRLTLQHINQSWVDLDCFIRGDRIFRIKEIHYR